MWDKGHPSPSLRSCGGPCTSLSLTPPYVTSRGSSLPFSGLSFLNLLSTYYVPGYQGHNGEPKGKRSLSSLTDKSQN